MPYKNPSSRHTRVSICMAGSLALALALCAIGGVVADSMLPPIQQQGAISYLVGGIGSDEAKAMMAERANYSLVLLFLFKSGNHDAFVSNVQVNIQGPSGKSLLETNADGPMMLVNLPAGHYRVLATFRGGQKTQSVDIKAGGHPQLTFEWQ